MGVLDFQFGVGNEVTYATAVTPSRFFAHEADTPTPIRPVSARTESTPLRAGSRARRTGRAVPYHSGGEGELPLVVETKGFGFWLQHMLGTVATTGAGPTYTHTATEGGTSSLLGKSFTAQVNYPFTTSGANQAITFFGGKVVSWSLNNDVEGNLIFTPTFDFADWTTATALATASYATGLEALSWVGGLITIGGTQVDVRSIGVDVNHNMNVDRRQIRNNTAKKEPSLGPLEVGWSIEADWESLTQFNRVHSLTIAGMSATIVGTWTNGTSSLVVTVDEARFDDLTFGGDPGDLTQTLTGVGEYDGTASPITVAYTTTDATP